ncbi:MAG: NIPSNAP family protein [Acidobacteriota bacterium]|nr:NIPSNAP family protein [Acidobacteriota bacterium]
MSEVFELRQYTLHPGKRDTLIELFDRELVETQEAAGMRVIGQFRDLGDPNRFVWFRGFPDIVSRKEALTAFYSDTTWRTHRDAANATMIDSDDVLLLRLVDPRFGFRVPSSSRPPIGATERPSSRFAVTVYSFDKPIDREHIEAIQRVVTPLTLLQTEPSENTYPALPVRAGENVIVTLTLDDGAIDDAALSTFLKCPPQRLRLAPTARSLLR